MTSSAKKGSILKRLQRLGVGSPIGCLVDFPGGLVVKNPPANPGDGQYSPWGRKESDMTDQLSRQ